MQSVQTSDGEDFSQPHLGKKLLDLQDTYKHLQMQKVMNSKLYFSIILQ